MLNERGHFVDDCVIYRNGPNAFMVVHGSGEGQEILNRGAIGRNVSLLFDDDLQDLSLQGPVAVDFLAEHVAGIRDLPYFHHTQTTLFGKPVMISRTGYTGERGYELFCKRADAPVIWDTVLEKGRSLGIIPCSFTALDWLRVESSLLFYPFDHSEMYPFADQPAGDTLWELGLDFTVSKNKREFRGAAEHFRLQGKERFRIFGVLVDATTATQGGDTLWVGERQVGVITCGMVSRLTGKSMAIARVDPALAVHGASIEVRGKDYVVAASSHTLPFDDPEKSKRLAKG
jgi:aminomethyltransferase